MYKVIGADNQVYGPVDTQQIRQWIQERRLAATSQLQKEGEEQFRPLSSFPEFADLLVSAAPPMMSGPTVAPVQSTQPPMNNMALTGFILGLLALICCSVFTGLPGIVCSSMGLSQISKNPNQRGRSLAIAGLVLSILGTLQIILVYKFRDALSHLQR